MIHDLLKETFTELSNLQSADCDHPTGDLNLRFWEDQAGPIISVQFRIKLMTFSEFRGEQYELSFLQCFFESARVLKNAVISMANPRFTSLSEDEMLSSVQNMSNEKWASKFNLTVSESDGQGGSLWTFKQGADFSDEDPFSPVEIPSSRWFILFSSIYMCTALDSICKCFLRIG
jgi:hypothetical protein